MPVPGYDPEDVDRLVRERLGETDLETALSADQLRRYEAGADLVDVLTREEIRDLLGERSKS